MWGDIGRCLEVRPERRLRLYSATLWFARETKGEAIL
jgi:hypothetical protein